MKFLRVRLALLGSSLFAFLLLAVLAGLPVAAQTPDLRSEGGTKLQNREIPAGTVLPVRLKRGLSQETREPDRK